VANGRVAFVSSEGNTQSDIYTMNPDGSDRKQLTFSQEFEGQTAWSPDGTQIAFEKVTWTGNGGYSEIFVMNANGSDQRRLTQSQFDGSPTWSPDGTKIAFWRLDSITMPSSRGIFVMNADGSDQRAVASTSNLQEPEWSPDGLKLAVVDNGALGTYGIHLINVDGSNRTQITQPPLSPLFEDHAPAWSPDGSKITFIRCADANGWGCWDTPSHLWVVNADGSNPTKLTDTQAYSPAWSPDGTKIMFGNGGDLLVMNPDGSGFTKITNTDGKDEGAPSWQALPLTLPNPIDDPQFFVRQHYLDFLAREPDPAGFAGWQTLLTNCPVGDTTCDRIHVSSSFFRSPEFQGRGYFVYRFYPISFGRKPDFAEFMPDLAKVSGFLTDAELEAAKVAFITEFMNRPEFVSKFTGLSNSEYVDTLLLTADIIHPNRDSWIAALNDGTRTRAQVLREISESTEVYDKYYNQAFVVMQYFGYLRRQPDALYLNWISHLDATGDYRSMINGFVNSIEYRERFLSPWDY
jgi:Tol biopolymer transport system component